MLIKSDVITPKVNHHLLEERAFKATPPSKDINNRKNFWVNRRVSR